MRKKIFLGGVGLLVLTGLILIAGTALATGPITGPNQCGSSGPFAGPNGLIVKKDVFCKTDRNWSWDILKTANQSNLTLATGESFLVGYTVTASAVSADSNFHVEGNINFLNSSSSPITIASVTDSLGPVTCEGLVLPHVLGPNGSILCTYEATLSSAAPVNDATVADVNGTMVTATAAIDWSKASVTETDECAVVSDTFAGDLGTVCAGAQTTFTFSYNRTIGPYDVCGAYTVDNTASFAAVDSNATGSSSWTVNVNVPCVGGCSLTPGYWKTHSIFGPAPYDDTWVLLGENASFFSSGKTYYQVLWTPPQGNAYYILAHAYIAAQLNQLNGADFSAAQAAFNAATALFSNPTNTPAYVAGLSGSAKSQWTNLATTLDNYNNGLIGPGHCSE